MESEKEKKQSLFIGIDLCGEGKKDFSSYHFQENEKIKYHSSSKEISKLYINGRRCSDA